MAIPNLVADRPATTQDAVPPPEAEDAVMPPQAEAEVRGVAPHREKRAIKKPIRYGIDESISYALVVAGEAPGSYEEAIGGEEAGKTACDEEMASLKKNATWRLVPKECEANWVQMGPRRRTIRRQAGSNARRGWLRRSPGRDRLQ